MNTHIIFRRELFLKASIYIIVCVLLGLLSTYILKSKVLSIIILIILVLPIFLMRLLIKRFTRKISIQFFSDHFTIELSDESKKNIETKIDLKNIASYNIQFPNEKFNSIKFRLRSSKSIEYSFFQKKEEDGDVDNKELFNSFHSLIKEYNNNFPENKIIFLPSFFATNTGLYIIIALSTLFIFTILLFSFVNEKSLPVTMIFSFLLILQLIVKRKSDLDYYKKMRQNY